MTEKALFTPSHVANFILKKAKKEGQLVTQLKLLKLVYLIYGWVLAVLDKRLFDESFEAWRFGPVIPSLYHEFKRFGSNPITDYSFAMDEEENLFNPFIEINIASDIVEIMTKAWEIYSPFTASSLVTKTHENDSPWEKHYKMRTPRNIIPNNEIKDYFVRKITEYVSKS